MAIEYVALYIRVSSEQQAKTGDSLREQRESLEEYVRKNENMIIYDIYVDDGISGQKLNRGEYQRLMSDIEAGHINRILFTKLDRWFRSLRHYLNTQAFLEAHQVTWTAVHQPFFDTSSAHGRAFVSQSMTWAELEAQTDSERILAVFENKVKTEKLSPVQRHWVTKLRTNIMFRTPMPKQYAQHLNFSQKLQISLKHVAFCWTTTALSEHTHPLGASSSKRYISDSIATMSITVSRLSVTSFFIMSKSCLEKILKSPKRMNISFQVLLCARIAAVKWLLAIK